ncbi:MAG: globin domain-containing protein [Cyanobacteria bacterium P01_F01_bin.143]
MSLKVELLEQSFNYIKPYGNLFVSNLYENLFQAHPETKSLFVNTDPETNKNQLWHDLVFVMENLHQPKTLKNMLQGLGARLFTYGALPEHYPLMRDALFSTFEQFLDSEWTAESQKAWDEAYVIYSGLMLDGAEKTRRQMGLINPVAELKEKKMEAIVSTDNSFVGEKREIPLSESANTFEEQVIIVEDIDPSPENTTLETTMSELDKNIPQNDLTQDYADDSLAEDTSETPLADLSKKLKSETVEPHFTQIFMPESQAESATTSTATATVEKSAAGKTNYQTEVQSNQSKNGWLIGGGVVGAIGLLLLILL